MKKNGKCDYTTYKELSATGHLYNNEHKCIYCANRDPIYCIQGDLNFDSYINARDIFIFKRIIKWYYIPSEEELAAADVNDDEEINALDLFEIKQIIKNYGRYIVE